MKRLLILVMMWSLVGVVTAEAPRKKLIELGWDIPTTQYLREHWKEMEETTPFDGIIYTLNPAPGRKGADSQGLFSKGRPLGAERVREVSGRFEGVFFYEISR